MCSFHRHVLFLIGCLTFTVETYIFKGFKRSCMVAVKSKDILHKCVSPILWQKFVEEVHMGVSSIQTCDVSHMTYYTPCTYTMHYVSSV